MSVKRIVTELGVERRCFACLEWWPEDDEFWYLQRGKITGRCRACWVPYNRLRKERLVATR